MSNDDKDKVNFLLEKLLDEQESSSKLRDEVARLTQLVQQQQQQPQQQRRSTSVASTAATTASPPAPVIATTDNTLRNHNKDSQQHNIHQRFRETNNSNGAVVADPRSLFQARPNRRSTSPMDTRSNSAAPSSSFSATGSGTGGSNLIKKLLAQQHDLVLQLSNVGDAINNCTTTNRAGTTAASDISLAMLLCLRGAVTSSHWTTNELCNEMGVASSDPPLQMRAHWAKAKNLILNFDFSATHQQQHHQESQEHDIVKSLRIAVLSYDQIATAHKMQSGGGAFLADLAHNFRAVWSVLEQITDLQTGGPELALGMSRYHHNNPSTFHGRVYQPPPPTTTTSTSQRVGNVGGGGGAPPATARSASSYTNNTNNNNNANTFLPPRRAVVGTRGGGAPPPSNNRVMVRSASAGAAPPTRTAMMQPQQQHHQYQHQQPAARRSFSAGLAIPVPSNNHRALLDDDYYDDDDDDKQQQQDISNSRKESVYRHDFSQYDPRYYMQAQRNQEIALHRQVVARDDDDDVEPLQESWPIFTAGRNQRPARTNIPAVNVAASRRIHSRHGDADDRGGRENNNNNNFTHHEDGRSARSVSAGRGGSRSRTPSPESPLNYHGVAGAGMNDVREDDIEDEGHNNDHSKPSLSPRDNQRRHDQHMIGSTSPSSAVSSRSPSSMQKQRQQQQQQQQIISSSPIASSRIVLPTGGDDDNNNNGVVNDSDDGDEPIIKTSPRSKVRADAAADGEGSVERRVNFSPPKNLASTLRG